MKKNRNIIKSGFVAWLMVIMATLISSCTPSSLDIMNLKNTRYAKLKTITVEDGKSKIAELKTVGAYGLIDVCSYNNWDQRNRLDVQIFQYSDPSICSIIVDVRTKRISWSQSNTIYDSLHGPDMHVLDAYIKGLRSGLEKAKKLSQNATVFSKNGTRLGVSRTGSSDRSGLWLAFSSTEDGNTGTVFINEEIVSDLATCIEIAQKIVQ